MSEWWRIETWHDDPEQVAWASPITEDPSTEEQELAVAAYKRWLIRMIEDRRALYQRDPKSFIEAVLEILAEDDDA